MSNRKFRSYRRVTFILIGAMLAVLTGTFPALAQGGSNAGKTALFLDIIKDKPPLLRMFMQRMPKGGDLHNHLGGAVYAETYLDWAAADGLCFDLSIPAILKLKAPEVCAGGSRALAKEAMKVPEDELRRRLIDGLSMRSFVPTPGWSGHDQFFVTFDRMKEKDKRFGDMLVEVTQRASRQKLGYLELMVTNNVGEMMGYLGAVKKAHPNLKKVDWSKWTEWDRPTKEKNFGDLRDALRAGYPALVKGKLGTNTIGGMVVDYIADLQKVDAARKSTLKCSTNPKQAGCEVVVRFLYQNIRKFVPEVVFTQFVFSFELMRGRTETNPVVGMNLVSPEDWLVATRDYRLHMEMLDFLWNKEDDKKKINIALHAGELTLGNVRPDELKYRIKLAIEKGHAERIGHGVAIAYEEDSLDVLNTMKSDDILIEINLTSNAKILNVSGRDHPMRLYHKMGVPIALSSDDGAVLRSDLTRDYVLAVLDQGFGYKDLKKFSINSLGYSFVDQTTKGLLQTRLNDEFDNFETWVKNMADKICGPAWWGAPTTTSC